MARQRKPENETIGEARVRQLLESVANNADRSEKTSWNRKMDNMVTDESDSDPIWADHTGIGRMVQLAAFGDGSMAVALTFSYFVCKKKHFFEDGE